MSDNAANSWQQSSLSIGTKLRLGFGILSLLVALVAFSAYVTIRATAGSIRQTKEIRLPTTLVFIEAETNLLRMLASTRGYLALGDAQFIEEYQATEALFADNLTELEALAAAGAMSPGNQTRLEELTVLFERWKPLPGQLFALRDNQLAREPAYQILTTEGIYYSGAILANTQSLIASQSLREPTRENILLLKDMADFQGSFASLLSGLRNYVTTQNRIYRQEYQANLVANNFAWETLQNKKIRLTTPQQEALSQIAENRELFLVLPEEVIFPILESEEVRQDLYLFTTEALPLNELMLALLEDMVYDEQASLNRELTAGQSLLVETADQGLWFGIIAIILSFAIAFLLQKNIAAPIKELTVTAAKIRDGNLQAAAPMNRRDELGVLAQTFSDMTHRLQATLRVAEKERNLAHSRAQALHEANEKLQSVDRLKSEFLANMSHELRTPLNAIIGLSQPIIEDAHDGYLEMEESYIQDIEYIRSAGEHLAYLINNLLDMSKIEAGRMEVYTRRLDPVEITGQVVGFMKGVLNEKPAVRFACQLEPDLPAIQADREKTRQILINLLHNAVKFTQAGQVILRVYHQGDAVYFAVEDTGIGIPAEQMDMLFEKFSRVDDPRVQQAGGSGLGLAIARELAELQGGRITVKSTFEQGSTFTFSLPCCSP